MDAPKRPEQGLPRHEANASLTARSRRAVLSRELPAYERVVLFGGVYNNYLALEALLDRCRELGVDAIFCLGDIGGFGPFPDRSFPFLQNGSIQTIAGNYDISLAEGLEDCGCGYTDPRDNHFAQISYDYTFQNTSAVHKKWLGGLPRSLRFRLGDRIVQLCHGSPRRVNEFLWESASPDHLLEGFLEDAGAAVMCCTHTGVKWHRKLPGGSDFINAGVIGRPENDGLTQVWFTLLEFAQQNLKCHFLPLEYDHSSLAADMRQAGLPEEFVETILTGWWTTCLEILPAKERMRGRY